jgi:hypothetical protein
MNNRFYVYHWLREDGTPYYVGKGQTNRAFDKRRLYIPSKDRIKIVKDNLIEQQALDLEMEEILKYGRKDLGTGILRNKTEGGDGHTPTEETRKKLSIALKGKNKGKTAWNKGKKLNYNNGLTGHKPEAIAKIKAARAKQVIGLRSEETKAKISKAKLGKKRPDMIGNKLSSGLRDNSAFRTPEWRQMISERMKRRWANA